MHTIHKVKHKNVSNAREKKRTVSASKCTKNRFAVGLRPDLLGELKTALPKPITGFRGEEEGEAMGRERKRREGKGGKIVATVISKSRRLWFTLDVCVPGSGTSV